jgi:peptide/nickel transport system substrate-binding protein
MPADYRSPLSANRITRRRALGVSAGVLGAAFLAACGGGSDSSPSSAGNATKQDKSGLVTQPADTSKQAKRGGTLKHYATGDAPSLDPMTSAIQLNQLQHGIYGRLTQLKAGYLKPREFEVISDLAQSWEWSPDRTQLTLKLRPGVKFHNKAPLNGRVMDTQDVVFSWERFSKLAPARTTMANTANPDAPVLSVTALDNTTVQIKLKEPLAYLLAFLANNIPGYMQIMPRETDGGYDIRRDNIGTGPFFLSSYTPGVGYTLKRNPDYYEKDYPLVDTVEMPFITEYAQAIAQLKAGNVLTYAQVRGSDVVAVKKEKPELEMQVTDVTVSEQKVAFGWLPAGRSPFVDERVRQALSMSYDRELFIDTFYNVSDFEKQGLPVDVRWNSHLPLIDGWWVDPRNEKEFGSNAKYFKHDVPEAKKLLAAAGHGSGLDVVATFIGGANYGTDYQRQIEVLHGLSSEAGFKYKNNVIDYQTEFLPKYRDAQGQHEGLTYKQGPRPSEDPAARTEFDFHSKSGQNFLGFDAAGKGDRSGDPFVDNLLIKARGEVDEKKRKAMLLELQNYLAKTMYGIRFPGGASGFGLAWPALGNFNAFRGDNRSVLYNYWVDDTKAPLKA